MDSGTLEPSKPSERSLQLDAGSILRMNKDKILDRWERRVRKEIKAARYESHPIVIDTLPVLLDQFAEALSPQCTRSMAAEGSTACQEHGGERARVTNYSIEGVIHEYQILRDILLDVLSAERPLSEEEKRIIWKSVDDVMKQAATAFSLVQSSIREQFFMTLTHDLRNPLSVARTNAQWILKYADKVDQHPRLAARIIQSVDRVDRMITDLLDANRVQAGERIPLDLAECDLTQIAQELIDELTIMYGKRFVLDAPPRAPGFWNCDGLRRSIENLVTNAIKYGAKDSPVRITVEQLHGRTVTSVHNRGNPIPAEEQETLFKAYHRSRSARESGAKGWGLGLALVRAMAEGHGGSVMLDSAPERGTKFAIDIPSDARPFQSRPAD
jgi:signal transduction histidine kinase